MRGAEVAAVYYNLRVAGDFYEFLRVGPSRVLFALLDLAGLERLDHPVRLRHPPTAAAEAPRTMRKHLQAQVFRARGDAA